MKDLRKQIIEIFGDYVITMSGKNEFIREEQFESIIDEILALPLYEKEFLQWVLIDCPFWYDTISNNWYEYEPEDKEYTLDEIYVYWKNLPK